MKSQLTAIFRAEHGRVMAAIVRRTGGDFDLAEDAVQHSFAKAVEVWGSGVIPNNAQAWLMSVARNHAIDTMRKRGRHRSKEGEVVDHFEFDTPSEPTDFGDGRLRLIFTCCHPALALEAQVALTLRTVCGLDTEEIARAFLVAPTTMAQRLVRAKAKIRNARIPYKVPDPDAFGERIGAVATVIYLVFNAGYSAPWAAGIGGETDLCAEAEWLARLVVVLLPGDRELLGLLALILLHGSRTLARVDKGGDPVLLEDQDRATWNQAAIAEGRALVVRSLRGGAPGPYAVQAAIAAVHAEAKRAEDTDWEQIAGLYDVLLTLTPTPVVELNRAVAVSMARGHESGLALLDALAERGDLASYPHLSAARADLLRRLGRNAEARAAYLEALELTQNSGDRRYLARRLAAYTSSSERTPSTDSSK